MYKLVFTEAATKELAAELEYSLSRWGKAHAKKYSAELQKRLYNLTKSPYAHRSHDDILPGLRVLSFKGNKILYYVDSEKKDVVILGVPSIYRELSKEALKQRFSGKST